MDSGIDTTYIKIKKICTRIIVLSIVFSAIIIATNHFISSSIRKEKLRQLDYKSIVINKIINYEDGTPFYLFDITPFTWDKAYYISYGCYDSKYKSKQYIHSILDNKYSSIKNKKSLFNLKGSMIVFFMENKYVSYIPTNLSPLIFCNNDGTEKQDIIVLLPDDTLISAKIVRNYKNRIKSIKLFQASKKDNNNEYKQNN